MKSSERRQGFTLVEILIVVSIIVILLSMILGGVAIARKEAMKKVAKSNVDTINTTLAEFYSRKAYYPGGDVPPDQNAFPDLFNVLDGMGGEYEPLMPIKETDIYVEEVPESGNFRLATADERLDLKVKKYLIDPWGKPYWYRENRSRGRREAWMHNWNSIDIWSTGPDKENQTLNGDRGDDLGNW